QRGRSDSGDLGESAGDPTLPERSEVTAQPLGLVPGLPADEVVVPADGARAQARDEGGAGFPGGTGTEYRAGRRPDREGRTAGEADRTAPEIRALQDIGARSRAYPRQHRPRRERAGGEGQGPSHVCGFCLGSMLFAPPPTP